MWFFFEIVVGASGCADDEPEFRPALLHLFEPR
jgi:hypothetical protein